jgi:formylglycine-generating enzyme required for sulfatase activity
MKNRAFPFLFIAALLLAEQAFAQSARYALVIGNGTYAELGRLKNPVNDARDIAAALTSLGFQVDSLADADLTAMEDAVVRLGNRLSTSKDSIGFFFYAGHGVQSNGINYLIPADAHIANASFLKSKALAAQEVLDTLQDAHNALNVVVLDACRDNPFSWARSGARGLSVVAAQPPGSIIAYATSAGSVAQDGAGRNGVFTAELLKNIRTPGMEIMEVFKRTGAGVQATTAGAQVPAIYNQYFGSAFLAGSGTAPAPAVTPAKKPSLTVVNAYGSVTVEVKTKGTIYLNGTAMGELIPGSSARLNDIEAGQASLEMRYADGKTETLTADVTKNAVTAVSFGYVERSKMSENMVLVEGGTFQMGDTFDDGSEDGKPVHTVTVSSFYVGKYEVTQKEWRDVMGTDPSRFTGNDLPVEGVSWFDAVDYCRRLSAKNGLDSCYGFDGTNITSDFTKNGFRLPTEAEWEYAAKGGRQSRGTKYAGSSSPDEVAWWGGNAGGKTHPVGQKQANELGLFDMSGNVWEWCWDWYGAYSASSQTDPKGVSSGDMRVLRGGCWGNSEEFVRAPVREEFAPNRSFVNWGFRVAASAQ